MLAVNFYFNLSFLTFLLNVLIIIKISGKTVTGDHHTSCVLIIIPSPMKEPKETPDEIMITGMTMNDRS